jgi:hypothetical protein
VPCCPPARTDVPATGADAAPPASDPTTQWDGEVFRNKVPGPHFDPGLAGSVLRSTGDVVSSASEPPRLALNIAAAHHDSRVGGRRLVYGAHTIDSPLARPAGCCPIW